MHRLALLPLVSEDPSEPLDALKKDIDQSDEQQFLNFILQQGLGPLWHETLHKSEASPFSTSFADTLKQATLLAVANYLRQQHTLQKTEAIFRAEFLPHAVFKGVHLREIIYSNPACRPACDIDILVAKSEKTRAIKSLIAAGFTFHPKAENISHEASLADSNIDIDLHWEILRPGRTRIGLTDELLATRREYPGHWGLSQEATLFIMLVHPVFTKYGTAPHASLIRMIDLVRWIQTQQIDWQILLDWLKRGGMQTAAWITTQWLEMLTGITLPETFVSRIRPSAARIVYLRTWISKNLSTRLLNYPLLIQAGFTLPAHDSFKDAVHAVSSLVREKRTAKIKLEKLNAL